MKEGVANDFPTALKVFRVGLILYDVLHGEDIKEMYSRQKITGEEAILN